MFPDVNLQGLLLSEVHEHFEETCVAELNYLLLVLRDRRLVSVIQEVLEFVELKHRCLRVEAAKAILDTIAGAISLAPHL